MICSQKALEEKPDLIVLDLMLPKKSGLDVCRELRKNNFAQPIIMLTAHSQEIDKALGLEVGADDYITKPFGLNERLACMRVPLRRLTHKVSTIENYAFGNVAVDFQKFKESENGSPTERPKTSLGIRFGTSRIADEGERQPVEKLQLIKLRTSDSGFDVLVFGEVKDLPGL